MTEDTRRVLGALRTVCAINAPGVDLVAVRPSRLREAGEQTNREARKLTTMWVPELVRHLAGLSVKAEDKDGTLWLRLKDGERTAAASVPTHVSDNKGNARGPEHILKLFDRATTQDQGN